MGVSISPYPRFKSFLPGTGNPNAGGALYTLQPGTTVYPGPPPNWIAPSYPMATFTDSTNATQNNNPIILDNNGEADVWLAGYTKLVLYDSNANLIWSIDNVSSSAFNQSTALPWPPLSTQVTFKTATTFSVPGTQTSIFTPGTRIQASIAGGTITGTIQSSVAGGTPVVTTVTVAWDTTQLNSSVTAIALSVIPGGGPTALPLMPVILMTATTFTFSITCVGQIFTISQASAITLSLPATSGMPSGAGWKIKNVGSGVALINATVDGAANPTLGQWNELVQFTDGTSWFGKRL